jgi:coenzyme PQQ precursor peptide PqqA
VLVDQCSPTRTRKIAADSQDSEGGDLRMAWVKPEFEEVRMDAEINSYILVLE